MRSGATLHRTGQRRRGDSFRAALLVGLLSGFPFTTLSAWGVRVTAFVSSQPGATRLLADYLRQP
jgi:sugar/nucleoside kinase (ribokinase family)